MARNPLEIADSGGGGSMSAPATLRPGESYTWTTRDKDTGQVSRTYTLMRTHRPYADDLADAYNAARGPGSPFESFTDKLGNIRLGFRLDTHVSREWKPEPGETEFLLERIAKLRAQGVTQEQFNRMIDEGKLR